MSTELAVVGIGRSDRHLDWVAELREKVLLALDENRILVLGCQVLLGIEFRSAFEKGFDKRPRFSQNLKVASLTALILAFGLLLAPSTYHRIVERGEDTRRFLRVVSAWMWPALLPFVFRLSTDLFVAGQEVLGRAGGTILGHLLVRVGCRPSLRTGGRAAGAAS